MKTAASKSTPPNAKPAPKAEKPTNKAHLRPNQTPSTKHPQQPQKHDNLTHKRKRQDFDSPSDEQRAAASCGYFPASFSQIARHRWRGVTRLETESSGERARPTRQKHHGGHVRFWNWNGRWGRRARHRRGLRELRRSVREVAAGSVIAVSACQSGFCFANGYRTWVFERNV